MASNNPNGLNHYLRARNEVAFQNFIKQTRAKIKKGLLERSKNYNTIDVHGLPEALAANSVIVENLDQMMHYFRDKEYGHGVGAVPIEMVLKCLRIIPKDLGVETRAVFELPGSENQHHDMSYMPPPTADKRSMSTPKPRPFGNTAYGQPFLKNTLDRTIDRGDRTERDDENYQAPRFKNQKYDVYLNYKHDDTVDKYMKDALNGLQLETVAYKYVYLLVELLLDLDKMGRGFVSGAEFKSRANFALKFMSAGTLDNIIMGCGRNNDGLVHHDRMMFMLDKYKYMPWNNEVRQKKHVNSFFGNRIVDEQVHYKPKQSKIDEHFYFLKEKLQEKFTKVSDTLKFFDRDFDTKIYLDDFKHGIDDLAMRMKNEDILQLFKMIDIKKDNFIDFEELCYFLGEKDPSKLGEAGAKDVYYYKEHPFVPLINATTAKPKFDDFGRATSGSKFTGNFHKRHNTISGEEPSPRQQFILHGKKSLPTENIYDILTHNFGREALMKKTEEERDKADKLRLIPAKKVETEASILRDEYIKESSRFKDTAKDSQWKMRRFLSVTPKVKSVAAK